ncbi:hypothetical protein PCC9214_05611 [Planktothrix tepida]|uniref:Uncharacterized protein n=1 Tax=Planktothrix tepida PCC 9214 TaxID=671072 RepID=A0A1J1LU23_9CYAN|nr:hypothetical protein [Planktothrix tepida]CAD5989605.1 hypothetical protein PCC9214_05611 [Planktothrix tepida]CUR35514.1 hypothetical protein PL9214670140 [Planktothrix tepida PCC 9214]
MLNSSQSFFDSLVKSSFFIEKTTILPSPLIESNVKLSDDEVNEDQEKEWFERWDASHLGHSDVDLHF